MLKSSTLFRTTMLSRTDSGGVHYDTIHRQGYPLDIHCLSKPRTVALPHIFSAPCTYSFESAAITFRRAAPHTAHPAAIHRFEPCLSTIEANTIDDPSDAARFFHGCGIFKTDYSCPAHC